MADNGILTEFLPGFADWEAGGDAFDVQDLETDTCQNSNTASFGKSRSLQTSDPELEYFCPEESQIYDHMNTPDQTSVHGNQLPSPREEDAGIDPGLLSKKKRREQNRAAQRAFRERKESRVKQLENCILGLKAEQRAMENKYNNLRTAHLRLKSGLKILLDASGTFDE